MNSKIAYYAISNPTGTAAEAPALPRVIPNGVANTNDVIADITAGIAATEARCRIALEALVSVALEHVRNGETVDLGGFRLKARIPGSMPCVDTPFGFGENTLVVDVLPEPELNAALADLVPYKVDANEITSMIKVSNVTDVATMCIGEIHGTAPFIITGNGVTLDAEGESATLVDRKTGEVLATAEVESVSKGQRATCAFAAAAGGVPRGRYWLAVTTFGLIGETTPRVFRKPVELVEPIPDTPAPTVVITKVKTGSVEGKIVLDEDEFQIVGEHLEKLEGDTLKIKGTSDQGEPVEYDIPYATFTCNADGTQLTVQITEAMRDAFYSGWTWDEVTLEYTSHAGVAGSAAQVTTGTAEVVNE